MGGWRITSGSSLYKLLKGKCPQPADLVGFHSAIHEPGNIPSGREEALKSCTRWEIFIDQSEQEKGSYAECLLMVETGWLSLYGAKGSLGRLVGLLVLSRQAQIGWPRPFFSGIAEHRHLGKLWLLMWGLAWVTLVTLTGLPYIHTLVSLDLRKQALLWECPARW